MHTYFDHVSVLKFIEPEASDQPQPGQSATTHPYVPLNPTALGDLFDTFDFSRGPRNDLGLLSV